MRIPAAQVWQRQFGQPAIFEHLEWSYTDTCGTCVCNPTDLPDVGSYMHPQLCTHSFHPAPLIVVDMTRINTGTFVTAPAGQDCWRDPAS